MPAPMKLSIPAVAWPVTNANLIGGGVVRRRFTMGERVMLAGTQMSGDEIRSIRAANRANLIEQRFLEVWPVGIAAPPAEGSTRVIVSAGGGKYHVIEGLRITPEPLSKEEAAELARAGRSS